MRNNWFGDIELGPALDEDVNFLQAIIKMTVPRIVVEFGHFWGKSALAMLEAMAPDAELHSFDNTKNPVFDDKRFHFYKKSQEEITGIENIDFVFLDASHDFELNKQTFLAIKDHLNEKAVIAVHDTGTWVGGNVFGAEHGEMNEKGEWVHCPGEIQFVNWLREAHPEFQQIHFHSVRAVRHGITLLQKYTKL